MPSDILIQLPGIDDLLNFYAVYYIDNISTFDIVTLCYTDTKEKGDIIKDLFNKKNTPLRQYFCEKILDKIIHEHQL